MDLLNVPSPSSWAAWGRHRIDTREPRAADYLSAKVDSGQRSGSIPSGRTLNGTPLALRTVTYRGSPIDRQERQPRNMSQEDQQTRVAIIDGSNVAYSTEGGSARLANIRLVMEKLTEDGYEPVVLVDAALRHQIDDGRAYEEMVDGGTIRQAPAGTDADYFILSFAQELDASIVSNDRFRDREAAFPDLNNRMIRYMIVNDEVVFEKRNKRR